MKKFSYSHFIPEDAHPSKLCPGRVFAMYMVTQKYGYSFYGLLNNFVLFGKKRKEKPKQNKIIAN